MDKTSKIVIAVVIVIIAAAGIAIAFSDNNDTQQPTAAANNSPSTQTNEENAESSEDDAEVAATITYTDAGFTLDNGTVQAGDTVRVVNNSDSALDFSSGPHPVHTEQQELNIGLVTPGSSKTFVVTEPGTWDYHNHEHDSHSGTITVE